MTDPIPSQVLEPAGGTVASINLDYHYGPGWEQECFLAYGIEPDARRIAYYRFLWDDEDHIGVSPDITRELQTLYR